MGSGEELVKAVLHVVERKRGNLKPRAAETGGADSDEQGGRGLPACGQIVETLANQISTRKRLDIHGSWNYTAEQAEGEHWWRRRESNPRRLKTLTG